MAIGDEFLFEGHLHQRLPDRVDTRGAIAPDDLHNADADWVSASTHHDPVGKDWVFVLGDDQDAGHWRLSEVTAGERFAFQGRVFETRDEDGDGNLEVQGTEIVISRVAETFARHSDIVIGAEIRFGDGSVEVITGTPEHPFYLPGLKAWVPLGEIAMGTALHVERGSGAVLVGKTWRQGDFEVFNFEVVGQHNYLVQASGNPGAGVLVHNTCAWISRIMKSQKAGAPDVLKKGVHATVDGIELAIRPDHQGGYVLRNVFGSQEGTKASAAAMKKLDTAMGVERFRGWVRNHAQAGMQLAAQEGDAIYLEFKFLAQNMEAQ